MAQHPSHPWLKLVIGQYATMIGMKTDEAKLYYLQYCQELPFYGFHIFIVEVMYTQTPPPHTHTHTNATHTDLCAILADASHNSNEKRATLGRFLLDCVWPSMSVASISYRSTRGYVVLVPDSRIGQPANRPAYCHWAHGVGHFPLVSVQ
jgi:hypothetical protein